MIFVDTGAWFASVVPWDEFVEQPERRGRWRFPAWQSRESPGVGLGGYSWDFCSADSELAWVFPRDDAQTRLFGFPWFDVLFTDA